MSKELDALINPPWPESITRLQEQIKFATLPFYESETMSSIQKLNKAATNNLASLVTKQSGLMKLAQLTAENNKLAFAWRESTAIKLVRNLTASNHFSPLVQQETATNNLASLVTKQSGLMKLAQLAEENNTLAFTWRESATIKLAREFAESYHFSSLAQQTTKIRDSLKTTLLSPELLNLAPRLSEVTKHLQTFAKTFQSPSVSLDQLGVLKQFSEISNLASFKALTSLSNSPLFNYPSVDFSQYISTEQIIDESFLEIDSQISKELSSITDFDALPEKTQSFLKQFYYQYLLPILLSCIATFIMNCFYETKRELEHVSTPSEAKAFVRSYSKSSEWLSLKGFRATIADSLNLRNKPSIKSDVITTLPIGTLVEVIDKKTHRSWLLVEVEINGEFVQGWVSRRYTIYFKE